MTERKIITYICPSVPEKDAEEICTLVSSKLPFTFNRVKQIEDLFPLLRDPRFYTDYIVMDVEYFNSLDSISSFEIINTLKTILTCTVERRDTGLPTKRQTKICGVVGYDTPPNLIKEMMNYVDRINMRIGGTWTANDIMEDTNLLLEDSGTLHPKVQELLKTKKTLISKSGDEIILTARQKQVLSLIQTRGASNKVIAKTLKISESTVKLHIGCILKKYGVKNRTQLAVFSKKIPTEV